MVGNGGDGYNCVYDNYDGNVDDAGCDGGSGGGVFDDVSGCEVVVVVGGGGGGGGGGGCDGDGGGGGGCDCACGCGDSDGGGVGCVCGGVMFVVVLFL